MCLETMRRNAQKHVYHSMEQFVEDVKLIVENCKKYNGKFPDSCLVCLFVIVSLFQSWALVVTSISRENSQKHVNRRWQNSAENIWDGRILWKVRSIIYCNHIKAVGFKSQQCQQLGPLISGPTKFRAPPKEEKLHQHTRNQFKGLKGPSSMLMCSIPGKLQTSGLCLVTW